MRVAWGCEGDGAVWNARECPPFAARPWLSSIAACSFISPEFTSSSALRSVRPRRSGYQISKLAADGSKWRGWSSVLMPVCVGLGFDDACSYVTKAADAGSSGLDVLQIVLTSEGDT